MVKVGKALSLATKRALERRAPDRSPFCVIWCFIGLVKHFIVILPPYAQQVREVDRLFFVHSQHLSSG
jgi:hypothetical protein